MKKIIVKHGEESVDTCSASIERIFDGISQSAEVGGVSFSLSREGALSYRSKRFHEYRSLINRRSLLFYDLLESLPCRFVSSEIARVCWVETQISIRAAKEAALTIKLSTVEIFFHISHRSPFGIRGEIEYPDLAFGGYTSTLLHQARKRRTYKKYMPLILNYCMPYICPNLIKVGTFRLSSP